ALFYLLRRSGIALGVTAGQRTLESVDHRGEYEAFLYRDSARQRYVVRSPCTDGGSRSVSHGHADRHPGRSVGFQGSGWRWNASALRRRQQRLRRHEAAVRHRTWHKHAAVTDRCVSGTTECNLLYAYAWHSHGGLCRHHDAALVLEGAK